MDEQDQVTNTDEEVEGEQVQADSTEDAEQAPTDAETSPVVTTDSQDQNFGNELGFNELDVLFADYMPTKTTYTVNDTGIEVINSVTVGDILIILLLVLLLFTQLLSRLVGRR